MTKPLQAEEDVQERSVIRAAFSTVALRSDQRSWDGELVPAGTCGTIVHVLMGGEAYVLDVTQPFDAIVTVQASELEAVDGR